MKLEATILGLDLQRIFGGIPSTDESTETYRADVWHVTVGSGELLASAVISDCVCLLHAPATAAGEFTFNVPAWLMSRVVSRMGSGVATLHKGRASTAISTPDIQFRILDSPMPANNVNKVKWPLPEAPIWRVDGGALRRAARIAATVASRSKYFPVPGLQLSSKSTGSLSVRATDQRVRADIDVVSEQLGSRGGQADLRVAGSLRHLTYGLDLLGLEGEPLDISRIEGAIVLQSKLGQIRIPELTMRIPDPEKNAEVQTSISLSRLHLLSALEAVAALNETAMSVSLTAIHGKLIVSGGSEKFGEVRAQIPLDVAADVEPFKLWRRSLEDWLRANDGETIRAAWSRSNRTWHWHAENRGTRAVLTMTTMV